MQWQSPFDTVKVIFIYHDRTFFTVGPPTTFSANRSGRKKAWDWEPNRDSLTLRRRLLRLRVSSLAPARTANALASRPITFKLIKLPIIRYIRLPYLKSHEEVLRGVFRTIESVGENAFVGMKIKALLHPLGPRGHLRRAPYQLFEFLQTRMKITTYVLKKAFLCLCFFSPKGKRTNESRSEEGRSRQKTITRHGR